MKNLITGKQLAKVLTTPGNLKHFMNGDVTIVAPNKVSETCADFIPNHSGDLGTVLWLAPKGSVVAINQTQRTVVFIKRKDHEWRFFEFLNELDDYEERVLSNITSE